MNPLRGEVPLTLADGRGFRLVLDFEALVQAEAAYGKPMPLMLADALDGFKGAERAILFGALRTWHPQITLRDASDMLSSDAEAVQSALDSASAAAFPAAAEDKEAGNAPAQSRARGRAGKASGRSGAKPGSNPQRSGGKPRAPST